MESISIILRVTETIYRLLRNKRGFRSRKIFVEKTSGKRDWKIIFHFNATSRLYLNSNRMKRTHQVLTHKRVITWKLDRAKCLVNRKCNCLTAAWICIRREAFEFWVQFQFIFFFALTSKSVIKFLSLTCLRRYSFPSISVECKNYAITKNATQNIQFPSSSRSLHMRMYLHVSTALHLSISIYNPMRERVFARKDIFIKRMLLNVYQKNKIYCHLKRVGDGAMKMWRSARERE